MRLFTRRGHDWTERYPAIAAVAGKVRAKSFTLDGEAVVTGRTGSLCSMPSTAATRPRTRCRSSFPPMRQQAMQIERLGTPVQSFEITHRLAP